MSDKRDTTKTRYGFRHLDYVRIRVAPHGTTAEVVGVVRRYPRTVAVPLRVAADLAAHGIPVTIVRLPDDHLPEAPDTPHTAVS